MAMKNSTLRYRLILGTIYSVLAACFTGLPFLGIASGSDIQGRQFPLYPYNSSIYLQEDFLSGYPSDGFVGALGMGVNNGTVNFIAGSTGRMGVLRRDTTATISTVAGLKLGSAVSNAAIDPASTHNITWVVRLNNNDANTTVRYGETSSSVANPPVDGIYIEKLDADTNWFCVTRSGGVQTRTDSLVAVNTNWNTFTILRNSTGVIFTINNTPVCTHTTNITAVFLNPGTQIINSAAVSKTHDHDYFQLIVTGLTR